MEMVHVFASLIIGFFMGCLMSVAMYFSDCRKEYSKKLYPEEIIIKASKNKVDTTYIYHHSGFNFRQK